MTGVQTPTRLRLATALCLVHCSLLLICCLSIYGVLRWQMDGSCDEYPSRALSALSANAMFCDGYHFCHPPSARCHAQLSSWPTGGHRPIPGRSQAAAATAERGPHVPWAGHMMASYSPVANPPVGSPCPWDLGTGSLDPIPQHVVEPPLNLSSDQYNRAAHALPLFYSKAEATTQRQRGNTERRRETMPSISNTAGSLFRVSTTLPCPARHHAAWMSVPAQRQAPVRGFRLANQEPRHQTDGGTTPYGGGT